MAILLEHEQDGVRLRGGGYGINQNREDYDRALFYISERAHLYGEAQRLRSVFAQSETANEKGERGQLERELLVCEMSEAGAQLTALALWNVQEERRCPANYPLWWRGCPLEPWYGDPKHEKSMHIADRLRRAFPDILMSKSENAMAVYRRVTATDIMNVWEERDCVLSIDRDVFRSQLFCD